jgi:glycerate kinase
VRVLVCPDKFAGTATAGEAARALAAGWRAAAPGDEVTTLPLADGGPGFLDVLAAALGGRLDEVTATDPLGRPVRAGLLRVGDTAYVESAQVCGLHLLAPAERDPRATTSYGLGVLLAAAVETGVRRVVVGLGGSGTNDGGAGALAALGAAPLDAAGYALPYGGAALLGVAGLSGVPRLRGVDLVAATDVDSPLVGPAGATHVFGPQKGARPDQLAALDAALHRYAGVLERALPGCPPGLADRPGAGAAGGIGAALLACGGRCESGFEVVRAAVGLDARLAGADLVVTGEGAFDPASLRGKVVGGVAGAARALGVPCVVVAGRVAVDDGAAAAAGVVRAWSLVAEVGEVTALGDPVGALRQVAGRAATYHGRGE